MRSIAPVLTYPREIELMGKIAGKKTNSHSHRHKRPGGQQIISGPEANAISIESQGAETSSVTGPRR